MSRQIPTDDAAATVTVRLPLGELAYDIRRERIGVVMDHLTGQVWLRSPRGGLEWTARPREVVPIAATDRDPGSGPAGSGGTDNAMLRARLASANARSRSEVG
ncbi:hypothetical protein [Embleya sp. NPDC059259]|uniref:hypothetical protein n=1 Tax=unclassified Embleya TaxID=2699296 RepID=UPI0036CBB95C